MSVYPVIKAFYRTALCGARLIWSPKYCHSLIKQQWGEDVLSSFNFDLKVEGTSPNAGVNILVGNHISYLDIPVLMSVCPTAVFISKDDLLRWPIIGASAKAAGTLFVSRANSGNRNVVREQIISKLLSGEEVNIVVFPSGTTTLDESLPWKKGIFEIAKQTKISVQLFHIEYQPLRESAYIGDDRLLSQMMMLSSIKNKTVKLKWIERFGQVEEPALFAEELRMKVMRR